MSTRAKTAVAAALLIVSGARSAAQDAVWQIERRALPPPQAASRELRESVAATPAPNVAERIGRSPKTAADWAAYTRAPDAARAQASQALAGRLNVAIEADTVGGVAVFRLTPAEVSPANAGRLFVHVHGGAYVSNRGLAGVTEAVYIAHRVAIPVLSVDYRMPPEHPFPAAVDDTVAVWTALLRDRRAGTMALGGTSAGGGLALAATLKLKADGVALPGMLWAGTPWTDLTATGDSRHTLEGIDRVLTSYRGVLEAAAAVYAGGHDLRDPLLSPVYGDVGGLPPTYLVTGTRDLFLSDTVRMHRALRGAGVTADLNVYEGVAHADYLFVPDAPESLRVFREMGEFLNRHLD